MLKEAINRLSMAAITAAATLTVTSCSDGSREKAQALSNEATEAISAGNYKLAIELLDSIDSVYPAQTEIRRAGMHTRAKAIEGQTLIDLQTTDSLTALATASSDELKDIITFVTNPVEGYYVAKSQKDAAVEKTEGIHARISPEGMFYIISSAKPGTNSTGVELSDGNTKASSASIAYDGERNDRSRGAEVITYTPAECDTIGRYAMEHANEPLTLTFTGGKSRSFKMNTAQAQALAQVYSASLVYRQLRLLQLQKQKLEQQLTISRSQQARTFKEEKK